MAGGYIGFLVVRGALVDLLCLRDPSARYRRKSRRGMTIWHNWIGGYPFEAATPEQVFDFYRQRGFALERFTTVGGGSGNNQFVLHRTV